MRREVMVWDDLSNQRLAEVGQLARRKCRIARSMLIQEMNYLQTIKGICPPLMILCGILGWFEYPVLWMVLFLLMGIELYATDRHHALWEGYTDILELRKECRELKDICKTKKQFYTTVSRIEHVLYTYYEYILPATS